MTSHRLHSIDILRGVAALGVVACHATEGRLFLSFAGTAPWLVLVAIPSALGANGVYLFFVISGFCIHLAWTRDVASGRERPLDFLTFWKRRVRRLYPPYLVALGLYLAVLAARGLLVPSPRPVAWDIALHLLMLHNLDPATTWTISRVFWTLAIEEQLYLAYFLLLAMRRRWGWPATLTVCLAARVAWFAAAFVLHRFARVDVCVTEAAAAHWFVWALGAWAVEARYRLTKIPSWATRPALGALALTGAAFINLSMPHLPQGGLLRNLAWLIEHPLWGVGFFIVVHGAVACEDGAPIWRWPSVRPLVFAIGHSLGYIGLFSYSLYLTHEVVLFHLGDVLRASNAWSVPVWFAFRLAVLSPLAVGVAWVFFALFERPFLTRARNPG